MIYFKRAEFWHRTGSRQCAAAILRIPTCEMPTGTELSASGERRTVDDKRDVDLLQVVDHILLLAVDPASHNEQ